MNQQSHKTHYRKVFKSDHLSVADLEDFLEAGSNLNFTITQVKQEMGIKVAGRTGNFNIAYFKENIKPLVLNATNSKVLKTLTQSSFVEDWKNLYINLYIDPNAAIKGEVVGGVRINPNLPARQQAILNPEQTERWNNAKEAYKRDGNLNAVKKRVGISPEHEQQLINEVQSEQSHV